MGKGSTRLAAMRFDMAVMRKMPRFRREIRAAKDAYVEAQVKRYSVYGAMSPLLEAEHGLLMEAIFKRNYAEIIKAAVIATPATIQGIKSEQLVEFKRHTDQFSTHERALRAWFEKYGGARARATAKTTTQDIRRLLVSAFEEGKPEAEVVRRGLLAKGLSAFRADVIARTETHVAAAFASDLTAREIAGEVGLTLEKAWVPVMDERTRVSHADMNPDEYIPMDGMFDVGGERLEYPGDPTGSPENVINCRCTTVKRVAQ